MSVQSTSDKVTSLRQRQQKSLSKSVGNIDMPVFHRTQAYGCRLGRGNGQEMGDLNISEENILLLLVLWKLATGGNLTSALDLSCYQRTCSSKSCKDGCVSCHSKYSESKKHRVLTFASMPNRHRLWVKGRSHMPERPVIALRTYVHVRYCFLPYNASTDP